ncbi:MAG: hypothetical protein KJ052_15130 [Candidatus Hydrogenedentes bacterium]|nr:hypothetical protein [Candidatus Hydrogenedentota bacterium]
MKPIIFESMAKGMLFLHLVAAVCCIAVAVHLLLRAWRGVQASRTFTASMRLHAKMLLIAYSAAFLLGGAIYPTYRVRVRGEYFDPQLPWATGLFEIKEHLASMAFLPVVALYVLSRRLEFHIEADRRYSPFFFGLAGFILFVFIYNGVAGWYLSSLKSL